jgi:hypothetical protein
MGCSALEHAYGPASDGPVISRLSHRLMWTNGAWRCGADSLWAYSVWSGSLRIE